MAPANTPQVCPQVDMEHNAYKQGRPCQLDSARAVYSGWLYTPRAICFCPSRNLPIRGILLARHRDPRPILACRGQTAHVTSGLVHAAAR